MRFKRIQCPIWSVSCDFLIQKFGCRQFRVESEWNMRQFWAALTLICLPSWGQNRPSLVFLKNFLQYSILGQQDRITRHYVWLHIITVFLYKLPAKLLLHKLHAKIKLAFPVCQVGFDWYNPTLLRTFPKFICFILLKASLRFLKFSTLVKQK